MGKKNKRGFCRVCFKKINVMAFRGTEFCSDVCRKKAGADVSSVGSYMFVTNEERNLINDLRPKV